MVVDYQGAITVNVLANASASIDAIRQLDAATGAWYNIFPEGQQGNCTVGAICWLNLRLRNAGTIAGTIYLTITRADGGAINNGSQSFVLNPNAYYDIDNISFVMPATNLTLNFEIGHY